MKKIKLFLTGLFLAVTDIVCQMCKRPSDSYVGCDKDLIFL